MNEQFLILFNFDTDKDNGLNYKEFESVKSLMNKEKIRLIIFYR